MLPLEHLTEQLWAPAFVDGNARVTTNWSKDPTWQDVERYWMVPTRSRASLLLPLGPPTVRSSAATNYRRLRTPSVNAARSALGLLGALQLPMGAACARIQIRASHPEAARQLPLAYLESALDAVPLFASMGVRTGANRKATLSLQDAAGRPAGYAKFGWNTITDDFVATESEMLHRLAGGSSLARVPKALATCDYFGHPVLVTEPLPLEAIGTRLEAPPPSSQEFYALSPIYRSGPPMETAAARATLSRLADHAQRASTREVAESALALARLTEEQSAALPIGKWWHGDLSSWNAARDSTGTLWVWDWETAEDDALAGLDPFHWVFSEHRRRADCPGHIELSSVIDKVAPHLVAAGIPRNEFPTIAAVYIVTIAERAATLVNQPGGWSASWIQVADLLTLIAQARNLLESANTNG